MKHGAKKISMMLAICLTLSMLANAASACTSLYVGGALTEDGSTIFGRSEDYSNSQNKLFYVAESGKHAAGEEYAGCYGFTWTFTHDSYGYTAFSDDNGAGVGGICPDCESDHAHTPYEAAGTNEKGLTITATETIGGSEAIETADPFEELGIEEAEITTVVLSEADSAKAAVALLTGIYDGAGANNGSGILIADAKEVWYVENVTGHQYVAVKLTPDMVMMQPNMVVIGAIDLDDTENVIASAGLIETAVAAGTFVGDQEANVIDYAASYGGGAQANARMKDGLAFLTGGSAEDEATYASDVYLITNVGADGIVPMHTGIQLAGDGKIGIADAQNFYHIPSIGYVRNLDTHLFQIFDDSATGTVEWVAMNDTALSVFVPYLPMLTGDTYEGYKVSTATAVFTEEEPAGGLYYATSVSKRVDGERVSVEGFMAFPENWADSVYWTNDVVSNLVMYGKLTDEQVAGAYEAVYAEQAAVNEAFAAAKAGWTDAETATAGSAALAQEAHAAALALANGLIGK